MATRPGEGCGSGGSPGHAQRGRQTVSDRHGSDSAAPSCRSRGASSCVGCERAVGSHAGRTRCSNGWRSLRCPALRGDAGPRRGNAAAVVGPFLRSRRVRFARASRRGRAVGGRPPRFRLRVDTAARTGSIHAVRGRHRHARARGDGRAEHPARRSRHPHRRAGQPAARRHPGRAQRRRGRFRRRDGRLADRRARARRAAVAPPRSRCRATPTSTWGRASAGTRSIRPGRAPRRRRPTP